MSEITLELIIIGFLLLTNGVFAMAEIALVSARKNRLQSFAAAGDARAKLALELIASPTRFLSTVQFGVTLSGIVSRA